MENDRNLPEDNELYRWKDPKPLDLDKWTVPDYEYQSILDDSNKAWEKVWSEMIKACDGKKYIGQLWEWLKENYYAPIKKEP